MPQPAQLGENDVQGAAPSLQSRCLLEWTDDFQVVSGANGFDAEALGDHLGLEARRDLYLGDAPQLARRLDRIARAKCRVSFGVF
jgi:hypothetical protein